MNAQDLKNSILQLAVQGKLVEQRPEEGTAKELFAQIKAEKEQLIKDKKIKKEKLLPVITEEEIPFDIPESWEWVRLGDIVEMIMGQSPKGTAVMEGGTGIEFHQGKVFFGVDYLNESNQTTTEPTKVVEPDTTLLCVRAPVGTANITGRKVCIGRGLCGLNGYSGIESKFILNWVRAFKNDFIRKATGTTFIAITGDVVREQIVPLPPLAEQKRIVAKIEEILPYIEQYDKAYTKLEVFNKKFPEDMKKSILQMAMQGKLVEQRPEEGTAEELYEQIVAEKARLIKEGKIKKEKLLAEITEDEMPFEIPESWRWIRIAEITMLQNGDRSSKYPVDSDYVDFGVPFFGAKDMGAKYMSYENVRYISEKKFAELGNGKLQDGDFICLLRGSVGKVAIYKADECHKSGFICAQMVILRSFCSDLIEYLYLVLSSPYYFRMIEKKTTGTAIRQLPAKDLGNIIVPLPPLAEQKRIVAKLEQMLPYCDQLIK